MSRRRNITNLKKQSVVTERSASRLQYASPLRNHYNTSSIENKLTPEPRNQSSEDFPSIQTPSLPRNSTRRLTESNTMQAAPRNRTQQQQSMRKMTPKPPKAKPEPAQKFEKRGRKTLKRGKAPSKSPISVQSRRSSKSPVSGRQYTVAKSSPSKKYIGISMLTWQKSRTATLSPISLEDKRGLREPREHQPSRSQVNLERRLWLESKIALMATQNASGEYSGFYTDRTRRLSPITRRIEDVAFFQNFLMRQVLGQWRRSARRRLFLQRRATLESNLQMSKGSFGEMTWVGGMRRGAPGRKLELLRQYFNSSSQVTETPQFLDETSSVLPQNQQLLQAEKSRYEAIIQEKALNLYNLTKQFEAKYVKHYLSDTNKLKNAEKTLSELGKRVEALNQLESSIENCRTQHRNYMMLEGVSVGSHELKCKVKIEEVKKLHKDTVKLWKTIVSWRTHVDQ